MTSVDHPLAASVIYPGSVERTAFAERHEDKAYADRHHGTGWARTRLPRRHHVPPAPGQAHALSQRRCRASRQRAPATVALQSCQRWTPMLSSVSVSVAPMLSPKLALGPNSSHAPRSGTRDNERHRRPGPGCLPPKHTTRKRLRRDVGHRHKSSVPNLKGGHAPYGEATLDV